MQKDQTRSLRRRGGGASDVKNENTDNRGGKGRKLSKENMEEERKGKRGKGKEKQAGPS